MVESWMDRIARPAAAASDQVAGQPQSPQTADQSAATGWDPYEVWYRQVKQVRDRTLEQGTGPARADVASRNAREEGPRRRVRIAGLLPRTSG